MELVRYQLKGHVIVFLQSVTELETWEKECS